jgi:CheY-like chemotaxis protein
MKILCVDDDRINLLVLTKIIERVANDDIEIVTATDGKNGLQQFQKHDDIDMIFTDLDMPIMDGFQLIQEIRQIDNNIKIIIVSGHSKQKVIQNIKQFRNVGYQQKPIRTDLLKRCMSCEKTCEGLCEHEQ